MKRRLVLMLALAACVETRAPITGTQSLRIDLISPSPGDIDNRLPDTMRMVVVDVTAIDPEGQRDYSFANSVSVYANFLGTLTPELDASPLATIQMTDGAATGQLISLRPVFGPTTLWFDDGRSPAPTYASGASPTLWYRDPYIEDIQRPADEMALDVLIRSPLESKQVSVRSSRYGANGRLVVTSVFAQGYTVSDVNCAAGGAPPCTTGDYDHAMVFTFSAPRDERFRLLEQGQVIEGFAGGVSEFGGLTEIGFPQTFVTADVVDNDPGRLPAPVRFDPAWFTNEVMFERQEAGLVEVVNATVCPLDADYQTYKQWKLAPSGACGTSSTVLNVISAGVVPIDPATLVGRVLPRVVGVLRPFSDNDSDFNVWKIYPRSSTDLTVQ